MFYLKMHMNVVCVCTCICVHSLHGQNKEFCSVLFCSVQVFRHKMDVSYSESSDYYSLDSYRDFEDFCEAVIRQTVEESRTRGPRH